MLLVCVVIYLLLVSDDNFFICSFHMINKEQNEDSTEKFGEDVHVLECTDIFFEKLFFQTSTIC